MLPALEPSRSPQRKSRATVTGGASPPLMTAERASHQARKRFPVPGGPPRRANGAARKYLRLTTFDRSCFIWSYKPSRKWQSLRLTFHCFSVYVSVIVNLTKYQVCPAIE